MSRVVHFVGTINDTRYRLTAYADDLDLVRYDNEVIMEVNQTNLNKFSIEFIEVHDD